MKVSNITMEPMKLVVPERMKRRQKILDKTNKVGVDLIGLSIESRIVI